jgi:hypothetical protein
MTKLIGDTAADMFRALVKDPNTATPGELSPMDIERLRLELNRLQGLVKPKRLEMKDLPRSARTGLNYLHYAHFAR